MGTLAAGIKEIFATAKTTGSNVMLCGNDGTPDGHMTMANLASILGKQYTSLGVNDDLNTCFTPGLYATYNTNNPANCPISSAYNNIMIVKQQGYGGRCVQFFYSINEDRLWIRDYGGESWNNWHEVSMDFPTFYKNYNNLASLVQGVCGLTMININLNNVISIDKVGCYITTPTCANAPTTGTFYIISLLSNLTDEWFLIAFNLAGSHLYVGFTRTSLTSIAWRTIV